jgi:bifunctional enzyme CysN/CysC
VSVAVPSQGTGGLLRIATAGSVDDGKSTLIGRLLYDSKQIFEDQLEQVTQASERRHGANGEVALARRTDGLRAEREQGITIDVAYRYFATPRRTFIMADTPGHVRYTRNMVTGASTAATLEDVVTEIAATRITERGETRADDRVSEAAMEDRKKAGYF